MTVWSPRKTALWAGGIPAPSLDLNFLAGPIDPNVAFTRAGSGPATYFDSAGVLQTARVNSIRNSTMVGASAGTPGTLPTNWGLNAGTTGLSSQVVGTGTEGGFTYLDFRIFGTAGATTSYQLNLEGTTNIAALTGQVWTYSHYWSIAAGSLNGIASVFGDIRELTAAGAFVRDNTATLTPAAAGSLASQRVSMTSTLSGGGTVGMIQPRWVINVTNAAAIDITFRIGLPQLELGATVSDPIATSTVANGAPRFDYEPSAHSPRGLLIEEARTNLCLNSAAIGSWGTLTDVTVTPNSTLSPDGAVNASLITEGTLGTALIASANATVTGSVPASFSVFAKRGNNDWIRIVFADTAPTLTNGMQVWVNLATGALGTTALRGTGTSASAAIQSIGNGWYRITGIVTCGASVAVAIAVASAPADSGGTRVNNATYYAWGGQIENSAFPTSYIPTGAASATRPIDSVTAVNGIWFNTAAGTFAIEFEDTVPGSTPNSRSLFIDSDATSNNRVQLFIALTSNVIGVRVVGASVSSGIPNLEARVAGINKSAVAYDANVARARINRGVLQSAAGNFVPASFSDGLRIGDQPAGVGPNAVGNIWTRRLRYWKTALSADQIQQVTA